MNRLSNLRILMTTDTVGGVWTYATTLASALAGLGAEVYLVTIGPRPRADQRAMLSLPGVHLIESDLALEWQDPESNDLSPAEEFLARLERQIKPDIVHLNSFREATFDWNAPVLVVAHSCVNSWGIACNDTAWLTEPKWRRYSELVGAGLDRAQVWVCPSRALRDVIFDLYRPHSPGKVIWNGIAPAPPPLCQKKHFILAAGRMWDTAKNLATLAQAADGLNWPVLVAGPPGMSPGAVVSEVELLGELSRRDLRRWMERAAIFVSPALYEPFGISVLEAASAGCALVLSDIPTFRELWDAAAVFVSPTDDGALRNALSDLCTDTSKRSQLQRAAFARARRFSIAPMTDAYAELYRELLPSGGKTNAAPAVEVPA